MTLHYPFPRIERLSDVLPAIEGSPEFIVAKRPDGTTVVNYVVSTPETFPEVETNNASIYKNAIRRECRGLVFETGTELLISRRFHKFFNVGERADVQAVDLSRPHVILEKMDGSMVTPLRIPASGGIRWGTKMGVTVVSMNAEEFVASREGYRDFAELCLDRDRTPIFEWCSRKNRIVLDYPEDTLTLLAVRQNETGAYLPRDVLRGWSYAYGFPLVHSFEYAGDFSLETLIKGVRGWTVKEGVVVLFDDGHMVKIKADEYRALHSAKSSIETRESNVVKLILENKIDDLKPMLSDEDKARLGSFETTMMGDIVDFSVGCMETIAAFKSLGVGREKFEAEGVGDKIKKAMCFRLWDCTSQTEAEQQVIRIIMQSMQQPMTNPVYERKIRPIISKARWNMRNIDA